MSGGGKTVCKGRMGSSAVSDVDTKDLANNETKLKKVIVELHREKRLQIRNCS